ncbi:hypothetical protein K9K85_01055 [Patescibacteria group bacterium]|nr:hypothetical protein [Patescibacteria group bacterium]
MKIKGIEMKIKETFLWAKIPLQLDKQDAFSLDSSSLSWEVKSSSLEVILRKRNFCPRTFTFQSENFLVFGYIESSLYAQLSSCLKKKNLLDAFIKNLCSDYQREFLLIVLEKKSGQVKVYRDAFCTLPIFYLVYDGFLFLSNEFINLSSQYQKGTEIKIDVQRLAERLFFRSGHADRTVFLDLKILSERSVLFLRKSGIKVKYPSPHPFPQKKKSSLALFTTSLERVLNNFLNRIKDYSFLGLELSGGVDSLTPLKFFKSKGSEQIKTFSLLLPSESGERQKEKLETIARSNTIKLDLTKMKDQWPLSSQISGHCLQPFYLGREIYFESLREMALKAKKKGIKFMVTGIGGDEAFSVDPQEKDGFPVLREKELRKKFSSPNFFTSFLKKVFREINFESLPLPLVPYSVLASNLARNNIYLRQNIWPLAPLAHPDFISFCRSLPAFQRKNKKMLRDYLQKQGHSSALTHPACNENFASFFEETIRRSEIKEFFWHLLDNSQLEKLNLIKKEELMESYLKYQNKESKINPLYFYTIITAEILLQSFD